MDEKKNEVVIPEEEITAAQEVSAADESVVEAEAADMQEEQPAEEAEVQDHVEAQEISEPAESEAAAPGEAVAAGAKKKLPEQKLLIIIAAAVLAVALIVGGVVLAKNIHDTRAKYTLDDGTPTPDSPEAVKKAHGEQAEVITGEDATKGAEVANSDAIAVISELSDKELGIEKAPYTDTKDKEHSFMVAGQSYIIENEKYVQVIAAEKKENKDGSMNITPQAKFYISFDGKTILKEDMENAGTYEKIK